MIVQDLNFDQTVAMAKAKAESMIQNGLYSRFGLSEKERLDKALLGCIGELAFQKHLKNLGIPFELDQTDFQSHHSDEFDVKVNGAKIDIKVAKKTTANPPTEFKVVTQNSYAKYPYLTPNHEFKWGCLTKDLNEILK